MLSMVMTRRMSELILYPSLPHEVLAFTTTRSLGRDRRRIASTIGIDESRIVMPHQVHSDDILQITPDFFSLSREQQAERLEGVDALFTDVRKVCIGVSTADCVPIMLYDAKAKVVASVHSGWRGTVKRIVQTTLARMADACHSHAGDVHAVIGPSISCDCYEVGEEVYDAFGAAGFPMDVIAKRHEKWHLDLSRCIELQLRECGVKEDNIYVEPLCTFLCGGLFFSARREQTGPNKCGRNFNAILLH